MSLEYRQGKKRLLEACLCLELGCILFVRLLHDHKRNVCYFQSFSPPLLCSTREGLLSDNLVVIVCYLVEKLSHLSFNQGISLSSNV